MHLAALGTRVVATIATALALGSSTRADDFERLEGTALVGAPASDKVTALDGLSASELGKLKSPFRDSRVPVILVRTGEGNLTRAVIAFAFRKSPNGDSTA